MVDALLVELRSNPVLRHELALLIASDVFRAAQTATEVQQPPFTTRRGEGPPGLDERAWRKLAPTLGYKPHSSSRWYVVDRASYRRWQAGQHEPATPPVAAAPVPVADAWAQTFDVRPASGDRR